MEQRVSLITLGVADLARTKAFYAALGWRGQEVESTVFLQAGGMAVVLWSRAALAEDSGVEDGVGGFGGVALAHNVRSEREVDDVLAEAAHAGATVTRPPAKTFYGGYAGCFADPDGHVWEIAWNPGFPLSADGALTVPELEGPADSTEESMSTAPRTSSTVRMLVVTGSLGAGKTATAWAVHDMLSARGERCAVIDLDHLCQLHPAASDDPFHNRLALRNLASVWPNYRAAGTDHLVVARVVEDPHDRQRYAEAVPGAELRIVRVDASSATRRRRLTEREPAGPWQDGHLRRTDALAEVLAANGAEDLVVDNDARPIAEVAAEVLTRLAW